MTPSSLLAPLGIALLLPLTSNGQEDQPEPAPAAVKIVEGDSTYNQLKKLFPGALQPGRERLVVEIVPNPDGVPAPAAQTIAAVRKFPTGKAAYTGGRTDSKSTTQAITQSGGTPKIVLVALAPGDAGTTIKSRPTLWWHQSKASNPAEIEFVLSEVADRSTELLRIPLKAMPKGFNSIDLDASWLDGAGLDLQSGKQYQWTIAHRAGDQSSAVYARLRRVLDDPLARQLAADPFAPDVLTGLSEAGNWYELFDSVALLARFHPDADKIIDARKTLLDNADLSRHLR